MSSNVDRFSHWRIREYFSINEAAALWIGKLPMEPWRDEFLDNEFSEEEKPVFLGLRQLIAAAIEKEELPFRIMAKDNAGAPDSVRLDYDLTFIARDALAAWAIAKDEKPTFFAKDIEKILQEGEAHKLTAPYLNPAHIHHSDELAIAIRAWLALFEHGKPLATKKSLKEQVEEWLDANYQDRKILSITARERIATLINPNKKGGAPSSGG